MLFAYVNNNIDIKRILQDKQFHLQLKSEQKEIIQNVLERKDSMAVLPTGFEKTNKYFYCQSLAPVKAEQLT
jgi:superfamily II DNA helicase RecQ